MLRALRARLGHPLRSPEEGGAVMRKLLRRIGFVARWAWRSAWMLAFFAMLTLNIASFTLSSVAGVWTSIIGAATGMTTVYDMLKRAETRLVVSEVDTKWRKATSGGYESKVRNLGSRLTKAETKLAVIETEADWQKKRAKTAETEVGKLRRETTVKVKGKPRLLREVVNETTERISKRTARIAATNLTAMAGESVPFWGIAVVVAATTVELSSACETMKDMEELRIALNPEAAPDSSASEVCGMQIPSRDDLSASVINAPGKVWEKAKRDLEYLGQRIPSWNAIKAQSTKDAQKFVDWLTSE